MRHLSPEEKRLWSRVVESVRPYRAPPAEEPLEATNEPAGSRRPSVPPPAPNPSARTIGTTLDGGWDRRLGRGAVQPDSVLDLHGHNLATAYDLLDSRLETAIAAGSRVLLLITGRPPGADKAVGRGRIRAAVGDWLAASRHAADIAAVRGAHPRHGGAGALYIVLRRRR